MDEYCFGVELSSLSIFGIISVLMLHNFSKLFTANLLSKGGSLPTVFFDEILIQYQILQLEIKLIGS